VRKKGRGSITWGTRALKKGFQLGCKGEKKLIVEKEGWNCGERNTAVFWNPKLRQIVKGAEKFLVQK